MYVYKNQSNHYQVLSINNSEQNHPDLHGTIHQHMDISIHLDM